MDQTKIDHCVETLSLKGCTEVLKIMALLENGSDQEDTSSLNQEERQAVLNELTSIMAVYQGQN